MNKLIIFVIIVLFTTQTHAMSATTTGGYPACFKKQWLEDVVSFVTAKDTDSFQAYLDSKKCVIFNKGFRVTVTESPGMFGSKAAFVFKGVKLWTTRAALKYGN